MGRPERDPYDLDVQLENTGIFFLNRRVYVVASALFAYLVDRRPRHSNAWYGLGNGLLMHSAKTANGELLKLALQCLRRSLQEDPSSRMAAELVEAIRARSGMPPDEFSACPAYAGQPGDIRAAAGFTSEALVQATQALASWEQRMQVVLWLGQQGVADFVLLLTVAAEHDPHPDVRMAALKRLPVWAHRPEVRTVLERMVKQGTWREVQPYFSMALKNIETDWAQRLLAETGDV